MTEDKKLIDSAAEKAAVDASDGRSEGRGKGRRKKKISYLTVNKIFTVDYKDVNMLRRYITSDRGKIVSSRQSGNTAKQQRMIAVAIKRAREMALLPFVLLDTSDEGGRRGPRPPREGRDYREGRDNRESRDSRSE